MTKQLKFEISINASVEKVWQKLWNKESYSQWTNVFCDGNYYKTDKFESGNRIHFLTPKGDGMYSDIVKIIDNQYVKFSHIGNINNFEEMPISDDEKLWTGAKEIYHLSTIENTTKLEVLADVVTEYEDYMNSTFPQA